MKIPFSLRGSATATAGTALFALAIVGTATQAAAPRYERSLAGIRLSSTAKSVLARFGNPNEIVIGDVGIRQGPNTGAGQNGPGGGDSAGGFPGAPGGGGPSNLPSLGSPGGFSNPDGGGGEGAIGGRGGLGRPGGFPGAPGGGFGGPPGGSFPGAPGGGFPGAPGGEGGFPGGGPGGAGAGGPNVGAFGQTQSAFARQQEVTWIYNRKFTDKKGAQQLVSYEFLIGPSGYVSQIRVTGYTGGNTKTLGGMQLGSTYRDVVKAYGYPEEHAVYGTTLVASYRNSRHLSFQFLNDRVIKNNVINPGNKVIGITIATVE